MDYLRQSLGDDEELVHIASFHWFYTLSAILNIVFGVFMAVGIIWGVIALQPILPHMFQLDLPNNAGLVDKIRAVHPGIKIMSFLVLVLGLFKYAHMMIIKMTTEIAVTNKRIIYKRGLVARYVGEMNIDRIEGVNVLQGVLGRIFNFGRIMVRGMGVGEVVLPTIDDPIKFRRAIEKAKTI